MAEKLLLYYKYIYDVKGFTGKIDLAKETKIPSTEAAIESDTLEKLQLFKDAILKITGKPAPNL
jgi:hypothetical protein